MRLLQARREGEGDGEEGDEHDAQRAEVERKQRLRKETLAAGPRMISFSRSRTCNFLILQTARWQKRTCTC